MRGGGRCIQKWGSNIFKTLSILLKNPLLKASLNKRFNEQGLPLKLSLASGNIQASLARPFVEFVVNKLDLTTMLDQLDNWFQKLFFNRKKIF